MRADNELEEKSLMNFLYLNACFYDFMKKSLDIYQKKIKPQSELTLEKKNQFFQIENEENDKLFFLQRCAIIDAKKENINGKKEKIKSVLELDLDSKLDEDAIFEKVDKIANSYHKSLSKEKKLFDFVGEQLFNFIHKSINLFYLIIKMIKRNESRNYSNLSDKYLFEENTLEEKIKKKNKEKGFLKNEINNLNQRLENNTKELMETKKKFDDTIKKLNEIKKENILLKNQIQENKIETEKKLKENEEKIDEQKRENILLKNQIQENKIETEKKLKENEEKIDEQKRENILLKNQIQENKIEAENNFKILKELNDQILEKMNKDQKIYDTYQQKIYDDSLANSLLNSIIEIQKAQLTKQEIELDKKNSEIERLNLRINALNIEKYINEKNNSNK